MNPYCRSNPAYPDQEVKFIKEDMHITIIAEKEVPVHFSVIPFIDARIAREDSRYHALNFLNQLHPRR